MPKRCALSFEEMCYVQSGLNYPPRAFKTFLHVKMYFLHVCVLNWNMGRYWLAVAIFPTVKAKALRHVVLFPLGDTLQTSTVSQIPESWTDSFYVCFISANWSDTLFGLACETSAGNKCFVCKLVSKLFFCLSNLNVIFFWGCDGGKGWWCLGITRADCSISKFLGRGGRFGVLCGVCVHNVLITSDCTVLYCVGSVMYAYFQ